MSIPYNERRVTTPSGAAFGTQQGAHTGSGPRRHFRAQRYGRCWAYRRCAQQLVSKPVRGEEDICIGLRETRSVSVVNGNGIAVGNRGDLTEERTGTCLDVISNVNCRLDEQFVCIRSVCDTFCVLRFVKFIAVLRLELELMHRRALWDWTRNTSWNDCVAVLSGVKRRRSVV